MKYTGHNDLTGKRFGLLTVQEYLGNSKWKCKCDCGNETIVDTRNLNSGKTKSCGCLRGKNLKGNTRNMPPKVDLTGKRFGKLTVIKYIKGGKWECQCDCGNTCIVDTRNLNSGHTRSCGCLVSIVNQQNAIDMIGYENDGIIVLERAGSSKHDKALWKCKCKHCGRKFITSGQSIRRGDVHSCGCVHSANEQKIIKMLTDANINFACQYTFADLVGVNNGKLRFDFAIFDSNHNLSHLIEYNGSQHYICPQGSWSQEFEDLQANDKRKIDYCKKHHIELRILRYDQSYTLQDLI